MMGFGAAIASCMRKYVTFSGRAPRAEYWWFILFTVIVSIVLGLIHELLGTVADFVFLVPTFAVGWRRMHDVAKSGLWNLSPILGLIPLALGLAAGILIITYIGVAVIAVFFLYVLYLTIKRGDEGTNEFGDDPYGRGTHDPSVFD